ncbi:MAG: hypothetical protein OEV66_11750 [Spirochaetia bacterium]|nr:hypothetical protein [Spirochaetia bacterium]
MAVLKFVHVMKRIETLQRDISEIHALAHEINPDRDYSIPVKISLEQQVNQLLNEKTKLMEVRIDNVSESMLDRKKNIPGELVAARPAISFDMIEKQYYEFLRFKRSNYSTETQISSDAIKTQPLSTVVAETKEAKNIPSLAEKSLIKPDASMRDDEKSFIKRREDILKNLPPLEY